MFRGLRRYGGIGCAAGRRTRRSRDPRVPRRSDGRRRSGALGSADALLGAQFAERDVELYGHQSAGELEPQRSTRSPASEAAPPRRARISRSSDLPDRTAEIPALAYIVDREAATAHLGTKRRRKPGPLSRGLRYSSDASVFSPSARRMHLAHCAISGLCCRRRRGTCGHALPNEPDLLATVG